MAPRFDSTEPRRPAEAVPYSFKGTGAFAMSGEPPLRPALDSRALNTALTRHVRSRLRKHRGDGICGSSDDHEVSAVVQAWGRCRAAAEAELGAAGRGFASRECVADAALLSRYPMWCWFAITFAISSVLSTKSLSTQHQKKDTGFFSGYSCLLFSFTAAFSIYSPILLCVPSTPRARARSS